VSEFPEALARILPADAALRWKQLVSVVPDSAVLMGGTALAAHLYHRESRHLDFFYSGTVDLDTLAGTLGTVAPFAITGMAPGTLNGVLGSTVVQFLDVSNQHPIEPPIRIAGLAVGAISDICATKLNALPRAELRDYFDLAIIETNTGLTVEEGLGLWVARYKPKVPGASLVELTRNLTYFEDVAEDDRLSVTVEEMAVYWTARYPAVVAHLDATRPAPGMAAARALRPAVASPNGEINPKPCRSRTLKRRPCPFLAPAGSDLCGIHATLAARKKKQR